MRLQLSNYYTTDLASTWLFLIFKKATTEIKKSNNVPDCEANLYPDRNVFRNIENKTEILPEIYQSTVGTKNFHMKQLK